LSVGGETLGASASLFFLQCALSVGAGDPDAPRKLVISVHIVSAGKVPNDKFGNKV
jgi:hypothetical protein